MTKDEAIALVKSDWGKELLKIGAKYAAPFCLYKSDNGKAILLNHGTIFFLNCGEGPFAVTAYHVLKRFLEHKAGNSSITCQIFNRDFDFEDRLIDSNEDIDIATFKITQKEVDLIGVRTLEGSQKTWPPPPPEKGRGVFFAGFPGNEKKEIGINRIEFGCYTALATVTEVGPEKIICSFDRKHMIAMSERGLPPQGHDIAGLSGAPLIALVDHNGIQSWRLAGIITLYNANIETLFAVRPDYILPDGHLNKLQS